MADGSQDAGTGTELIFAGNTIRLSFTLTTGGSAVGVTVAEYGLFDRSPAPDGSEVKIDDASKTLGSGITVSDGSGSTVVADVVLQPADTAGLVGDYYHELKVTASGDEVHMSKGTLRLQQAGL